MHLTNLKFVNMIIDKGVDINKFIEGLIVCLYLIKRHGKIIFSDNYIDVIGKVFVDIKNTLIVLKKSGKINQSTIKTIISLLKNSSDKYVGNFVVHSNSMKINDELIKFVKNKFNGANVDLENIDDGVVKVSGEGYYYKRSLEQDLEKLLYCK